MTRSGPGRLLALLLAVGLAACSSDPSGPQEESSWEIIQHDVLAANCVSCHTSGTSFARQSSLVLTPDAAYDQLVGVAPSNAAAAEAGLLRVSDQGPGGLEKSYLWEKLNAPAQDHFYGAHPGYGEIMPLGRAPLTNGELEFIRRWIAAGAPEKGSVVDVSLLTDTQRFEAAEFTSLSPPAFDGMQLHLAPFDVVANHERELYTYMPLDNADEMFVNRFEVSMRPGSHHFILYTYSETTPADVLPMPHEIRDLRDDEGSYFDENGEAYFDYMRTLPYLKPIMISQSRRHDYSLPPGVALRLPANAGLELNAHYANYSDETMQGEAYVNLHTLPPDEVEHVARGFALTTFDIFLPAGQQTRLERDFILQEDRHIVQLVSHAHDRLTEFTAEIIGGERDGELIYVTYDWEHPAPLRFDPPLDLEAGQGFRLRATYDNQTDRDLIFGFTREDEMMILYGYYYTD